LSEIQEESTVSKPGFAYIQNEEKMRNKGHKIISRLSFSAI